MITRDNIIDLWDLYSEYLENYKANFRDDNYMFFEEYVADRVVKCDQCGEYYDVEDDYVRNIEGTDDHICEQCLTNGWGQ
jgi:formylmethanofuran dehydrogenase subunit E